MCVWLALDAMPVVYGGVFLSSESSDQLCFDGR